MSVTITGLDKLRAQIETMQGEVTRPRRQQEGREMVAFAKSISPTEKGLFRKEWRYRTSKKTLLEVYNTVAYAPHVKRPGSDVTVHEEVVAEAQRRAPQLSEDLKQLVTDHLNS